MAKNKPRVKGRKGTNAAKRKQEAVANLKAAACYRHDLDDKYRLAARESMAKAMLGMLWCMRTEYGFGRLRTMRCFVALQKWFTTYIVNPDHPPEEGGFEGLNYEDIADTLYEETGIYINPITAIYKMDDKAYALYMHVKFGGEKENE